MKSVIWWVRRDLRLENNPALHAALQIKLPVIPLFILDPKLLENPPSQRQVFLFNALHSLQNDIANLGNALIIRKGNPLQVLHQLFQETEIEAIFAEEDYSPYALQRDQLVQQAFPLHLIVGLTIHHPQQVLKSDGTPYTVFTPFSKNWKSFPKNRIYTAKPDHLPTTPIPLSSLELPESFPLTSFPASEEEANLRLHSFLKAPIFQYATDRNMLDQEGTSTLSPYLRFGLISIQTVYQGALKALQAPQTTEEKKGVETWINELIWREFYISILYHFPNVLKEAFYAHRRHIPWRNDASELNAWQQGLTGYPIVDACMRQLNQTGWMHNRGRMIVASFLTKDLLHNWQEGEHYFMQKLVDGDSAANNGGWQWTAGVGTDASPYFRIFNPILQSKKFDSQGVFIRKWLPELKDVPKAYLHEPWTIPADVQEQSHCIIGKDYPQPIVDRSIVKERVMNAFQVSQ